MWLWVVTDGPPHHEAWGGACVLWANALWKMMLTMSTLYTCKYITRIQTEPTLIIKGNDYYSTLQSTLSWHQSSRAWQCHAVSVSLARGTRDLSPAASRQFPVILDDTAGATLCLYFFSAVQAATTVHTMRRSWCASVLNGHPEPGLQVWECSQTTAESSDTLPIHCAQHVQQSVDMSIHLPAGLQCDSIQMAEVVQLIYLLICRAWLYPRVNVANTLTSQSTTVSACRVKTDGAKTGLLSAIWSPIIIINESLMLNPLSVPWFHEHGPWGCCIFVILQCVCVYIYRVFHEVLSPVTEHVPEVIWKYFS